MGTLPFLPGAGGYSRAYSRPLIAARRLGKYVSRERIKDPLEPLRAFAGIWDSILALAPQVAMALADRVYSCLAVRL